MRNYLQKNVDGVIEIPKLSIYRLKINLSEIFMEVSDKYSNLATINFSGIITTKGYLFHRFQMLNKNNYEIYIEVNKHVFRLDNTFIIDFEIVENNICDETMLVEGNNKGHYKLITVKKDEITYKVWFQGTMISSTLLENK